MPSDELGIDGAAGGIVPSTALKMLITDDPVAPGDRHEPDEMRERVMDCPLPVTRDGDTITLADPWAGVPSEGASDEQRDEAYSRSAYIITRGLLHIHEQVSPFIDFDEDTLWGAFRSAYPEWCEESGVTGFQVGYAMNLFRVLTGQPTGGNPAIIGMG